MERYYSLVEVAEHFRNEENKGVHFIHEDDEEFITYAQLYKKSLSALYALQAQGIQRGDELLFQIEDNKKFVIGFWACILGGIIPIPVTVAANESGCMKVCTIWKKLKTSWLITDVQIVELLEQYNLHNTSIYEEMKKKTILFNNIECDEQKGIIYIPLSEQTAFIQFSSGSTGDPKGVVLSHENLTVNIHALCNVYEIQPDDALLSWMPLTHDMGLITVHISAVSACIDQYIMPTKLFIRKPILWMQKASEHKISGLYAPNFGYGYFLQFYQMEKNYHWDLSSVRYIANGAEPISIDLCNRFLKTLSKYNLNENALKAVYGLAEATVGVSATPINERIRTFSLRRKSLKIGDKVELVQSSDGNCITYADVGYPVDDCYIRICDENDNLLEDYTTGIIHIYGRNVMGAYYDDLDETSRIKTKDGWLRTGDLGFMSEGRLTVIGRYKEMILVHGQNYYPHDIENAAMQVEGIELWNIAACGLYNQETCEDEIIVFVIFKRKLEFFVPLALKIEKQIRKSIGLNIKHVIPIKRIPKTTSGKVQHYKLKEMYEQGAFLDTLKELSILKQKYKTNTIYDKTLSNTEEELLKICREEFNDEYLEADDNLYEIGGDSIKLAKVYVRINERYPNKIEERDLFIYYSVAKLAAFINSTDNKNVISNDKNDSFVIELNQIFDNIENGAISLEDAEYILDEHGGNQ